MLDGRSTNFIIALQNRLSYASRRRIKALLLRCETTQGGRTGIRAKRNTPKKAQKFKHIQPPSGEGPKKRRARPGHIAGSICPPGPEPAMMHDAINRIWC
jgi:hypothetical protein